MFKRIETENRTNLRPVHMRQQRQFALKKRQAHADAVTWTETKGQERVRHDFVAIVMQKSA